MSWREDVAAGLATPPPDGVAIAPLLFTVHPCCPELPAWQGPRWQATGIAMVLSAIVAAFRRGRQGWRQPAPGRVWTAPASRGRARCEAQATAGGFARRLRPETSCAGPRLSAAAVPMIFALSSGPPPSGVAVLRLCGDGVFDVARRLTGRRGLPPARTAMLRSIHRLADWQVIDQALVLVFPGPASFTGEDTVELHTHGSPAVIAAVQQELLALGLRPAEPGEFTRRAFMNGRIDLTQAEALADLIAAETEAQRDQALANAGGRLRQQAEGWREAILALRAETEADLDFADESDVSVAGTAGPIRRLAAVVRAALASAPLAERVRTGLTIAVTGPPNAGKSSLVNALAGREVAIVTAIPGTTRDVLEVHLDLGGVPATLLDTAGLRDSDDPVEQEGIRRARARAASADLVLDLGAGEGFRVVNKVDETGQAPGIRDGVAYLSATTGAGLEALRAHLVAWARAQVPRGEPALVTTARQAHLLDEAAGFLEEAAAEPDSLLRAESLRLAAASLGRLTGAIGSEEVLGAIFGRFCIGK